MEYRHERRRLILPSLGIGRVDLIPRLHLEEDSRVLVRRPEEMILPVKLNSFRSVLNNNSIDVPEDKRKGIWEGLEREDAKHQFPLGSSVGHAAFNSAGSV